MKLYKYKVCIRDSKINIANLKRETVMNEGRSNSCLYCWRISNPTLLILFLLQSALSPLIMPPSSFTLIQKLLPGNKIQYGVNTEQAPNKLCQNSFNYEKKFCF